MQSHNLMQVIARVNRVFKEAQCALVVDYIGIGSKAVAAVELVLQQAQALGEEWG